MKRDYPNVCDYFDSPVMRLLRSLQNGQHSERGKNVPITTIVGVALGLLDAELCVIEMEIQHPEHFAPEPPPKPLAKWCGTIAELIEYMLPLQVAGKLGLPSGKVMEYADLIRFIECGFGISIHKPYERKSEVVRRTNPTPFIEKMLNKMKEIVKLYYQ